MEEKIEYLKNCIQERLKSVDSKRLHYRKKSLALFIGATILSALITVLLGLKIDYLNEYVRIITLILTSVLTVLNAYNGFFNNKELWIANNVARNRLYELQFKLDYAEKDMSTFTAQDLESMCNAYQTILNDLNGNWEKNRLNKK